MIKKRKTVIITGASGGIGCATALIFAKHRYNLVLCYNKNQESINNLCEKLDKINCRYLTQKIDFNNENQILNVFIEAKKTFGTINVLINNAGICIKGLLEDQNNEQINSQLNINLKSAILLCRDAEKYLSKEDGSIINISSMWGLVGSANEVIYSATKAGLIGLTKALAKELASAHITVNCLALGAINTKMLDYTKDEIDDLINQIPMQRLGKPKEVAETIYFLVNNRYITGEVLNINGGLVI